MKNTRQVHFCYDDSVKYDSDLKLPLHHLPLCHL